MQTGTRKRHFDTLDAMRGVAALAVVSQHMPSGDLRHLVPSNYLAVDLFFVLSGFVLAHSYTDRLKGSLGWRDYAIQRLIRLFPLHALGILIGAVVMAYLSVTGAVVSIGWPHFTALVGWSLLFLPTPNPFEPGSPYLYPFNLPAWSLFWEMAVSLAFGWIAPRLTNRLLAAIVVAGAVGIAVTAITLDFLNVGARYVDFWGGLARVTFSFFAGVAVYRLWQTRRVVVRVPAWVLLPVLLAMLAIPTAGGIGSLYELVAVLVLFPALVLVAAENEPGIGWARPFEVAGASSFAVYVLHAPIIRLLNEVIGLDLGQIGVAGCLALVAVIVVLALVVDRFYDKPVRAWMKSRRAGTGPGRLGREQIDQTAR